MTLLCAWKPEPPDAPTTFIVNDLCFFDWEEPILNGVPITGYQLWVRKHDSTEFVQEAVECDGYSTDVIDNSICSISLFSLIEEPFSLVQGESIYAKIVAENVYGSSTISLAGNGALCQVVPSEPINLVNDIPTTNAFNIGLDWDEPTNDGGTPVIDYRVWYKLEDGEFYELTENVIGSYYLTTFDLVPGANYDFKVQARNSVGYSLESNVVTIKAARKPDPPTNV